MPVVEQPAGMTSDKGVILTVGGGCNGQRVQISMPFATESTMLTPINLCSDAVLSFQTTGLPQLLDLMSPTAFVSFMQAEGMDDGKVPFRHDFDITVYVGTGPGVPVPNNVAPLLVFYQDPADLSGPGAKIRVGKTFIFGAPTENLQGDALIDSYFDDCNDFAILLQNGIASSADSSSKWYRVLAAPRPRGTALQIKRTVEPQARGYVATQRRRMLPH